MKHKVNMFRILNINDLTIYLTKEKWKNFEKKDTKRNLEDIQNQLSLIYNLGTNKLDINNNIITKWMIRKFL